MIDNSDVKQRREENRAKQIVVANKGLRKPEMFKPGDTVYLRDQEGHWKIPATVMDQRKHQGFDTLSYVLINLKSRTVTTWNERDLRKFPAEANQTADTLNDPADTDRVITWIMKQDECMKAPKSIERADGTEPYGSAHGEQSTDQGIKTAHTPEADIHILLACALTVNPHGSVSWAKTIQVIYFEEPQV